MFFIWLWDLREEMPIGVVSTLEISGVIWLLALTTVNAVVKSTILPPADAVPPTLNCCFNNRHNSSDIGKQLNSSTWLAWLSIADCKKFSGNGKN